MTARATIALTTSPVKNRRRRPRQPCSLFAEVRALTGRTDVGRSAEICDISEEGCGMIVGRSYQVGTLLHLKIFDEATGKQPVVRAGPVCHMTAGEHGGWILGVDFATQLTAAEVVGLIGSANAGPR